MGEVYLLIVCRVCSPVLYTVLVCVILQSHGVWTLCLSQMVPLRRLQKENVQLSLTFD